MTKQQKDALTLLKFESVPTNKTALQIIEEEVQEEQQAKLCYDLFEKMVMTKQYDRASKLCNVLYYRFNIDVTC